LAQQSAQPNALAELLLDIARANSPLRVATDQLGNFQRVVNKPAIPANQAVAVGDAVGVALGYGIGKALGTLASKYGPAVAEIFAQRAAEKTLPEMTATFRPATFEEYIGSVEDFGNGANQELAQESYQLYQAQNWVALEHLFTKNKGRVVSM